MLHETGKTLPKNNWDKFTDIEWYINSATTSKNIADVIAKYREDMIAVLKQNEAEWTGDEGILNGLKDKLERKKTDLETGLWTMGTLNLTNNNDIINFWKWVVDGSSLTWTKADTTQKNDLDDIITRLLNNIQFLQDDWNWNQTKKFKLFMWTASDITNFEETLKDQIIKDLLNQTNPTKVKDDVERFVNSMKRTRNPFYIKITDKLFNDKQWEVSMRIVLYLYCLKKLINDDNLTENIYNEAKTILESQIEGEEIPKIKWLHNTKKELWYITPEYETLKDLNVKHWDINLWNKNITTSFTEIQDLTTNFENWIATWIEKYEIDKNLIVATDADWNALNISLSEPTGRDLTKLFSNINDGEKIADMHINIGWTNIKIGALILDNTAWNAKLHIMLDDSASINWRATTAWVTLPNFPFNLEIPVKGTKNVKSPLKWCKASLTKKYKIALETWLVTPFYTGLGAQRERQTTITNVDQVNRAIAEREADEELRERYRHVGWNILDRANLLLRRKFIKDKIVRKNMKWRTWIDWSSSPDASWWIDWNESWQSAAHRHQIEEKENLSDNLKVVVDIDEVNYPETRARLDTLIDNFTWKTSTPPRTWWISEDSFKTQLNDILSKSGIDFDTTNPTNPNRKPVSEIIKSNNLELLSTNLIMQAKQFQAHQLMISSILNHITANPTEWEAAFNTWCRTEIENYINIYDDIPDFLHQMGLSLDNENDIKTIKAHTGALTNIQAQSLKYRLQILDGGDEAYNVRKNEWWSLFTKVSTRVWRRLDDPTENTKLGKWLEKHPNVKESFGWIRWGMKIAAVPTALFFATTWPLATAWIIGGVSGLTALLNKKSHYEKEHRSYQRMQATNLTNYRNKRTNLANEVGWMKRYEGRFWWKKKRTRDQFRDYVAATHDQLELTNNLTTAIKTYLKKGNKLQPFEKDELSKKMADWLARLDYHKKTGQNFLWSNDHTIAEKEYKELQNAIIWWMLRLNIDTNTLRTWTWYSAYYNLTKNVIENWTGSADKYNTQWYLKARKRFEKRSNLKALDSALMTWWISFGLSYLASNLASQDKIETKENYTPQHSWTLWWEYNPWDVKESLLISWSSPTWSINPEMCAHINWTTSQITWAELYSSVDAIPCSVSKWSSELTNAYSRLSTTLSYVATSDPSLPATLWWNTSLVDAVNNYISQATADISAISWLDAGNRSLNLARAIEDLRTWILEPLKISWNTSVIVNPHAFVWKDVWAQASWSGIVWQSFRNMGIIWVDYIKRWTEETINHVTRAIAIPVWLNTFWSPESDPK